MKQSPSFSTRLGFLAAASGAAIGLANIWKFPYEVGQNGGAWYLIIYTFFVFILGYPLVLIKTAIGRKQGKGLYETYRAKGSWNLVAFFPLVICVGVLSFYNVVTGWILGYGVEMLRGTCLGAEDMGAFFGNFISSVPTNLFYNGVISLSVIAIVRLGVEKGIERWSKILMPVFLCMLLGLIVYACTLQGAKEGIAFYLWPKRELLTMESFGSALSHAFMSLALGTGVMITYGAYAGKKENIVQDSMFIVLSDFLIAFLAGLLIFPLAFHGGVEPNGGPSLIFLTLPMVLSKMGGIQSVVIGTTLFLLLVFAAVTSAISMLEIPVKYVIERWNLSRTKSVFLIGGLSHLLGMASLLSHGGSDFFTNFLTYKGAVMSFMDVQIFWVVNIAMPLSAMLFSLFVGQHWKEYQLDKEINTPHDYGKGHLCFVYICLKYVAPVLIGIILMSQLLIPS
ncbi:MAG: sodium-dependent transporter [Bacteroidota bacterium]